LAVIQALKQTLRKRRHTIILNFSFFSTTVVRKTPSKQCFGFLFLSSNSVIDPKKKKKKNGMIKQSELKNKNMDFKNKLFLRSKSLITHKNKISCFDHKI
jgi:hypothetical protein